MAAVSRMLAYPTMLSVFPPVGCRRENNGLALMAAAVWASLARCATSFFLSSPVFSLNLGCSFLALATSCSALALALAVSTAAVSVPFCSLASRALSCVR